MLVDVTFSDEKKKRFRTITYPVMIYARALTLDNSRLRLIVLADQLFNVRQFFVQVLEAIFGPLMLEILFHFVVFPNYSFLYLLKKSLINISVS